MTCASYARYERKYALKVLSGKRAIMEQRAQVGEVRRLFTGRRNAR